MDWCQENPISNRKIDDFWLRFSLEPIHWVKTMICFPYSMKIQTNQKLPLMSNIAKEPQLEHMRQAPRFSLWNHRKIFCNSTDWFKYQDHLAIKPNSQQNTWNLEDQPEYNPPNQGPVLQVDTQYMDVHGAYEMVKWDPTIQRPNTTSHSRSKDVGAHHVRAPQIPALARDLDPTCDICFRCMYLTMSVYVYHIWVYTYICIYIYMYYMYMSID